MSEFDKYRFRRMDSGYYKHSVEEIAKDSWRAALKWALKQFPKENQNTQEFIHSMNNSLRAIEEELKDMD